MKWCIAAFMCVMCASQSYAAELGYHAVNGEAATPEKAKLVMFWRADCEPCMREMEYFPDLAQKNASLPIAVISLQDAETTRAKLPALPANVQVLVADGDAADVLRSFGDEKLMLPFSLMRGENGKTCQRHFGMLGSDILESWKHTC